MKVLLVSPDPKMRERMAVAVASAERGLGEPLVFLEARDGIEGIKRARIEHVDVVVTEQTSSRAGGFALAKDLRGGAVRFDGGIVILLDRDIDWWLAQWSGADAWFTKPVDPFALADTVVGLIQRTQRNQKETA